DSDRDRLSMRSLDFVRILLDGLLHPKAGVTGAHRMILMSDRRPEEGHNPVAHDPIYSPLVTMDGFEHAFEHRVDKLLSGLGVVVGKNFHRPLDVGEKHGDLLAFSLKRGPCGQDFISKALRRVILGRGKTGMLCSRY